MIDDIETEVEQGFILAGIALEQCANVQFQFVKYLFVDVAIRVDQIAEELILLDGLQVFVTYFDTTGSR